MAVYLDNAATTAVLPEAAKAALETMTGNFGNPSSLHEGGRRARALLDKARASIALALGCLPEEVTFTSCGTESINTVIDGAAFKNKHMGKHIVSTSIEHDAVLNKLNDLKGKGYEITLVPPERDGTVSLDRLISSMREDTILVTMQGVNNETGAILPFEAAAEAYKEKNPSGFFHLDGVQTFLKRPMPLKNIDFASVSAHKIGGMKGSGAMYIRKGVSVKPLLYGGNQESGMRSGTEGMPQISAFMAAVDYRLPRISEGAKHMSMIKESLISHIKLMGGEINTPYLSADHIVNFSMCRGRSEIYIRVLSDCGVYVSGGSACSRGRRSHVLEAMRLPKSNIDAALRASFCPENSAEDIEELCLALEKAVKMF
ncbi:MAG: cysteine desulfurase family protein [Clostridiaceae bacterium]|nr:cysteine desulfurase family protein [Clostridiaceae bacterium]